MPDNHQPKQCIGSFLGRKRHDRERRSGRIQQMADPNEFLVIKKKIS